MQKIIFKKFLKNIKKPAIVAVVFAQIFAAMFAAAWVVLPANGAEAAFGCDAGAVN